MASILATLNVSKAKDASGNIIEPVEDGMPGAIKYGMLLAYIVEKVD